MRNREVARRFANGQPGSSVNFYSPDGVTLYSYGTVLAYWKDGHCFVNVRKYSKSTTNHQHMVLSALPVNLVREFHGPEAKMWASWREGAKVAAPMTTMGRIDYEARRKLRVVK